jgi:hypothetical protein
MSPGEISRLQSSYGQMPSVNNNRGNTAAANRLQGAATAYGANSTPTSLADWMKTQKAKAQPDKPVGPPVYDLADPGSFKAGPDPDPYPTVLPSLSAAQLGSLAERRSLADRRLKEAEAAKERGTTLLEASALRARQSEERGSRRSIEDFMRQAGGKGTARSPMIAGRFQRREGEDLRTAYGEIDTRLSTEIATLQDMVSRASLERADTIASLENERVNMQADLERLFPASQMYG